MGATETKGKDKPPARGVGTSSAATSEEPPIGRDCKKCLEYLTCALDRVGERPQSLLRALGVITHVDRNGDGDKLYEPTEDGRGVLISLKNTKDVAVRGLGSRDSERSHIAHRRETMIRCPGQDSGLSIARGDRDTVPLPSPNNAKENHSIGDDTGNVTLVRRLTKAAHLLTDGIRHSAEDILNDGAIANDIVLTTSPAVESSTQVDRHQRETQKNNVTTIAIDCQTCGSDTRAEAGARAFVRGPEPLSIVLCSNRLSSQREVDEVLVHELIHIYDVHSRKMDLRDCHQLARSEVRAAREAECSNSFAQFTANICVKDKATVATRNMFPEEGKKCVCDVFSEAMSDMAPFDEDGRNNPFSKVGASTTPTQQSPPQRPPFPFPQQSDR